MNFAGRFQNTLLNYQGTFEREAGITPSQPKVFQKLKSQNLRDPMTDLKLLFSMLGEAATTEMVQTNHPQGFEPNRAVAITGVLEMLEKN